MEILFYLSLLFTTPDYQLIQQLGNEKYSERMLATEILSHKLSMVHPLDDSLLRVLRAEQFKGWGTDEYRTEISYRCGWLHEAYHDRFYAGARFLLIYSSLPLNYNLLPPENCLFAGHWQEENVDNKQKYFVHRVVPLANLTPANVEKIKSIFGFLKIVPVH